MGLGKERERGGCFNFYAEEIMEGLFFFLCLLLALSGGVDATELLLGSDAALCELYKGQGGIQCCQCRLEGGTVVVMPLGALEAEMVGVGERDWRKKQEESHRWGKKRCLCYQPG